MEFNLKLKWFYSPENFSNTYILGPASGGGKAIVIDPGIFHLPILEELAKWRWEVGHILITNEDQAHIKGLKTLLKIFQAEIYSSQKEVYGIRCHAIHSHSHLNLDGVTVGTIHFNEYHGDNVVYWIGKMVFTGDVLYAGSLNTNRPSYFFPELVSALKERLIDRAEDLIIYPGEGPPTTIKAERDFNPWFQDNPPTRVPKAFL